MYYFYVFIYNCLGLVHSGDYMKQTKKEQLMKVARERGLIRARELTALGIPRHCLTSLVKAGKLEKVSRGVYASSDSNPTTNRSLAQAAKRVPRGVVCLLSALRFHNLTTQLPSRIWLAIDRKGWRPQEDIVPLHIVRFSGKALSEGIETHRIEGSEVRIYSVAKTIADCFKYRNKVGLDVAIEALRESHRARKCSMDEIWQYAKVCRVTNVMKPYLEAIV